MYDVDEVEEFLEHFGVKGQKWGVRRANRQRNKALNKASKFNETAALSTKHRPSGGAIDNKWKSPERRADIQRARDRISSGAARAELKMARLQRKKDKINLGSREAKKILKAKKSELSKDWARSQEAKNGLEIVGMILGTAAAAQRRSRARA